MVCILVCPCTESSNGISKREIHSPELNLVTLSFPCGTNPSWCTGEEQSGRQQKQLPPSCFRFDVIPFTCMNDGLQTVFISDAQTSNTLSKFTSSRLAKPVLIAVAQGTNMRSRGSSSDCWTWSCLEPSSNSNWRTRRLLRHSLTLSESDSDPYRLSSACSSSS